MKFPKYNFVEKLDGYVNHARHNLWSMHSIFISKTKKLNNMPIILLISSQKLNLKKYKLVFASMKSSISVNRRERRYIWKAITTNGTIECFDGASRRNRTRSINSDQTNFLDRQLILGFFKSHAHVTNKFKIHKRKMWWAYILN